MNIEINMDVCINVLVYLCVFPSSVLSEGNAIPVAVSISGYLLPRPWFLNTIFLFKITTKT